MRSHIADARVHRCGAAVFACLSLAVILLAHRPANAQAVPRTPRAPAELPVLHAHSNRISIQDGAHRFVDGWTADSTVALDVYCARRSAEVRRIQFISDVDSIEFEVRPGNTYDFSIRFNEGVECHTRISTLPQRAQRAPRTADTASATIPFTIRNGKLHVSARVNGSPPLDLVFDTGADINVLYPSGIAKGVALHFDGSQNNAGTGGSTLRRTSSVNNLEVEGWRWDQEPILYIEAQADSADGILGYRVFEDKVLELDYDRMVLAVHDSLPSRAAQYARAPMSNRDLLTTVELGLTHAGRTERGWFILDTGAAGTLMVNQAFATGHQLHGALKRLGTSTLRGVGSGIVRNEYSLLPGLLLGGVTLPNVPINVEMVSSDNVAPAGGALGLEVLERFNTLIDYPRNEIYFKPNARFGAPFEIPASRPNRLPALALALVALVALVALLRSRRRAS